MRPALTNEAFLPREEKLFARTVQQYPGRETGFWRHLIAIAALMAVVMMVVGVVAR